MRYSEIKKSIILEYQKMEIARVKGYNSSDITNVPVWINPNSKELSSLIEKFKERNFGSDFGILRGLIDTSGNVYVWDSYEAEHNQITKSLGINTLYFLYINQPSIECPSGIIGADLYFHDVDIEQIDSRHLQKILLKNTSIVEKVEFVSVNNTNVKVFKNPSYIELKNLCIKFVGYEIRKVADIKGIIDENGDLYVWDAYTANHNQIIRNLALRSKCNVYIDYYTKDNRFVYNSVPINGLDIDAKNFKSFRRAMGYDKKLNESLEHLLSDIRPPSEDVYEVIQSNFNSGKVVGNQLADIKTLHGGVSSDPKEQLRVNSLIRQMKSPQGYFRRLIVDQDGNVIEGQHRLEAARKIGLTQIPIVRIQDTEKNFPSSEIKKAINAAKPTHSDHVNQLVAQLADIYNEEGSAKIIRDEYEAPRGFETQWNAGIDALSKLTESIKPTLDTFLAGNETNAWVKGENGKLKLYLRKSRHNINGKLERCLDLSNLSVSHPNLMGKGLFSKWLAEAEPKIKQAGFPVIYVENVLEQRFVEFWEKRGYTKIHNEYSDISPCLYKIINEDGLSK